MLKRHNESRKVPVVLDDHEDAIRLTRQFTQAVARAVACEEEVVAAVRAFRKVRDEIKEIDDRIQVVYEELNAKKAKRDLEPPRKKQKKDKKESGDEEEQEKKKKKKQKNKKKDADDDEEEESKDSDDDNDDKQSRLNKIREKYPSAGFKWTDEEVSVMLEWHHELGKSWKEIGERLKRPPASCAAKFKKLKKPDTSSSSSSSSKDALNAKVDAFLADQSLSD